MIRLVSRRDELARRMRFANVALASLLILSVTLGILAWIQARIARGAQWRAEAGEQMARSVAREREEQLWQTGVSEARVHRSSGRTGQRLLALNALKTSTALRPDITVRNEAIAALSLPDASPDGPPISIPGIASGSPIACDADLRFAFYRVSPTALEIRDLENNTVVNRFQHDHPVTTLAISPDGQFVGWVDTGGGVRIRSIANGAELLSTHAPSLPEKPAHSALQFSHSGRSVLVEENSGTITRYFLNPFRRDREIRLPFTPSLFSFSPDEMKLLVVQRLLGESQVSLQVWDWASGRIIRKITLPAAPHDLAWDGNEPNRVAVALPVLGIRLLSLDSNDPESEFPSLDSPSIQGNQVRFSSDSAHLVRAGTSGGLEIWELASRRLLLNSQLESVVGMSRTGDRLLCVDGDGRWIRFKILWPETYRSRIWEHSLGQLETACFAPDGRQWMLGNKNAIWMWDPGGAHPMARFHLRWYAQSRNPSQKTTGVLALACRSNAAVIHALTPDALHQIPWNSFIRSASEKVFLEASRSRKNSGWTNLALSSNGRRLLTIGHPTAMEFDADSLNPLRDLGPESTGMTSARYLSGGNQIVTTGGMPIQIRRWNAEEVIPTDRFALKSTEAILSPDGDRVATSGDGLGVHPIGIAGSAKSNSTKPDSSHDTVKFLGWETHSKWVFGQTRDGALTCVDPQTLATFAKIPLDSRASGALRMIGSPDGSEYLILSPDNHARVLRLANLRKKLSEIGLNWPDTGPVMETAPSAAVLPTTVANDSTSALSGSPPEWPWQIITALSALALALIVGVPLVLHQRVLFRNFEDTTRHSIAQQERLRIAEKAISQSEKLQALGTLSAGVAHDFNNLLSIIRLSNGIIRRDAAGQPDIAEETATIDSAVERGKKVVQSILGYSRQRASTSSVLVPEIVESMLALLGRHYLGEIRLELDLQPDRAMARLDPSRFEQMLLNLAVNAAEAMKGNGRLVIRSRSIHSLPVLRVILSPKTHGPWIEIVMDDTGPGIPESIQDRIFDPFFTTKHHDTTPGTGLGLATVYRIANEEGIGIGLDSAEGRGARFHLWIPEDLHTTPGNPG